jgi:hypothetical protein
MSGLHPDLGEIGLKSGHPQHIDRVRHPEFFSLGDGPVDRLHHLLDLIFARHLRPLRKRAHCRAAAR